MTTTQPSNIDMVQQLEMVKYFYDTSWSHLLIMLGVVGVLVPAVMQLWQYLSARRDKTALLKEVQSATEQLRSEFRDSIEKSETALRNKIADHIEGQLKLTIDGFEKRSDHTMAAVLHVYANTQAEAWPSLAIGNYISAAELYLKCGSVYDCKAVLGYTIGCLFRITRLDLVYPIDNSARLIQLVARISESPYKLDCSAEVSRIETAHNDAQARESVPTTQQSTAQVMPPVA